MIRAALCFGVMAAGATGAAAAEPTPMWAIASQWRCDLKQYLKLPMEGPAQQMEADGRSYAIDFDANEVTSPFGAAIGKITRREFSPNGLAEDNVVFVDWGGGPSVRVISRNGETWHNVLDSGWRDEGGALWVAAFACVPGAQMEQ